MSETLSRRRAPARGHVIRAYDTHGDLIFFDEVDDQQGSNARPSDLEKLCERRQLALSWGSK